MKSQKITVNNHTQGFTGPDDVVPVRGKQFNDLIDDFNAHVPSDGVGKLDTLREYTAGSGVTVDGVLLKDGGISSLTTKVQEFTKEVTLTAAEIVGTDAGMLGHASGVTLVAALGTEYALEFVSAVLIYDFDTAAYTGGGDDTVIRVGTVAHSTAVAKANLLGAAGDKIARLGAIATDLSLPVNTAINLKSTTAWTQPGTAAGVLRVQITYRVHTTSL